MKINLTPLARRLRKDSTPYEIKMWQLLKNKRFENLKFRRQYPIGNYIVDFCCPAKRLIIELDGGGHNEPRQIELDAVRDEFLKIHGFKVLRIWNNELINNQSGVFDRIEQLISENTPHPCLRRQANSLPLGERGS